MNYEGLRNNMINFRRLHMDPKHLNTCSYIWNPSPNVCATSQKPSKPMLYMDYFRIFWSSFDVMCDVSWDELDLIWWCMSRRQSLIWFRMIRVTCDKDDDLCPTPMEPWLRTWHKLIRDLWCGSKRTSITRVTMEIM